MENNATATNKLIEELVSLNTKLNSGNEESNVQLVFLKIKDERDPIIDKIMIDEDVYSFCKKQSDEMNRYYKIYGSDICFEFIVDKILRILLKNLMLFDDIKNPKGFMLSYCFLKPFGTFKNRIWSYFKRYSEHFEETKGNVSLDKIMDNESYSDMQDYFEANNFDLNFTQSVIDSKDERENYNKKKIDFKDNEENMCTNDEFIIENEDMFAFYDEDENDLSLALENHPTIINRVITLYDIPYQSIRLNSKYIHLSTEEYKKKIDKIKKVKLRKWNIYKNESGILPHDVTKFKKNSNYFKIRNNKDSEYIHVVCKGKDFDFSYVFFDKKVETYIKNIITKKLSKKQQLLIGYLYYKMLPVDEIISSMNYVNKTAMNKEKNRALKILKYQLLKDYDFIQNEYGKTFLAYWLRLIKTKISAIAKKEKKMLSIK